MAKTILITGVTGFVGSSLAATMLNSGDRIIALSRNDADGVRTLTAINSAVEHFGFNLETHWRNNVEVIAIDYDNLEDLRIHPSIRQVDEVWHSAAEMTYSKRKMDRAFSQNVEKTTRLYKILATTNCQRFYYISTAYTGGIDGQVTTESLHLSPVLTNSYQASKWAAELALSGCASEMNLPVTIFRPSIVVGHEQSGWRGNSSFGFYMFLENLKNVKLLGVKEINLDLDPNAIANLIPINRVTQFASELSKSREQRQKFEIVHASAQDSFSVAELGKSIGDIIDLKINFAKPRSKVDHLLAKGIKENKYFANKTWIFSQSNLVKALGKGFEPFSMTSAKLDVIICRFLCSEDIIERRAKLTRRRDFRLMKAIQTFGNLSERAVLFSQTLLGLGVQNDTLLIPKRGDELVYQANHESVTTEQAI